MRQYAGLWRAQGANAAVRPADLNGCSRTQGSAARWHEPQRRGASDNLGFRHHAEVAAVEAVVLWRQEEEIAGAQPTAAPPGRHDTSDPIAPGCAGHQQAADEDPIGKKAHAVTASSGDDLDQVCGFRQL